jgi:methionine-gamma-lyase
VDEIARSATSVTLAVSLGHTKTQIELPSSMTHSSYGQAGAGVRLSIGLESPDDILADLRQAMEAVERTLGAAAPPTHERSGRR